MIVTLTLWTFLYYDYYCLLGTVHNKRPRIGC